MKSLRSFVEYTLPRGLATRCLFPKSACKALSFEYRRRAPLIWANAMTCVSLERHFPSLLRSSSLSFTVSAASCWTLPAIIAWRIHSRAGRFIEFGKQLPAYRKSMWLRIEPFEKLLTSFGSIVAKDFVGDICVNNCAHFLQPQRPCCFFHEEAAVAGGRVQNVALSVDSQ